MSATCPSGQGSQQSVSSGSVASDIGLVTVNLWGLPWPAAHHRGARKGRFVEHLRDRAYDLVGNHDALSAAQSLGFAAVTQNGADPWLGAPALRTEDVLRPWGDMVRAGRAPDA